MEATNHDEFDFFDLDDCRLDKEWKRQPKLFFEHAKRLADAKANHAAAKADLDLTRAEQDELIRDNPGKYGIDKIRESAVANKVEVRPEVEAAVKTMNKAKHRMDVLQAAVDALEHRKRALENLVTLFCASYFSEPRSPKGVDREAAESFKRQYKAGKGSK